MADFVLNIRSELVWDLDEFKHFFYVRGAPSPGPDAFGLNPPSQLTGYRVSLVSVSESGSQKPLVPNSLQMLSTKSIKTQELRNPFQKIAHIRGRFFFFI